MISWIQEKSNKLMDCGNRVLAPIDIRIERNYLAVIILLVVCSSKWIFEGLLAFAELQVFFVLIGTALIVLKRRAFKPIQSSRIWFFFIISIFFNVTISGGSLNILGRALLTTLIIAYVLYLDCDDFDIKKALEFLAKIGIFHALMVLIHFILKDNFTKLYLPLLNPLDYEYATAYVKEGYYFGILTSPHEVAGLIVFSVMTIIWWNLNQEKAKHGLYILAASLLVPLLLTGKKGALICAVASMGIFFVAQLIVNKKWRELQWFVGISVIALFVFVALILLFPEVKIFYRLNQLLTRLISGRSLDSARKSLYKNAIVLWSEHPLFGIGWRQFKEMSINSFGYRLAHQVNCDYLQWLCELGIIGFTLNMIPVVITFWRAVIVFKDGLAYITDRTSRWIVQFALNTQLFVLMYAIVEVPFYDIMFFSVYILSCIIVNSAYEKLKKGEIYFCRDTVTVQS